MNPLEWFWVGFFLMWGALAALFAVVLIVSVFAVLAAFVEALWRR